MSTVKQKITTLQNYPGNKSSSAAYPTIMNHIPAHKKYIELFSGSAGIGKKVYTSGLTTPYVTINEINPVVYELLKKDLPADVDVINCDALKWLQDHVATFSNKEPGARDEFIYMDPPYVLSSRRSGGEIYDFEMSDNDHEQLLLTSLECRSNIMISGYDNPIYNEMLKDWYRVEFQVMTRRGAATEVIWMNYNIEDYQLHTYDYIGQGRTDRQRLNRKQLRMINKIRNLPKREREKLMIALKKL